jgi:hypothetical protein
VSADHYESAPVPPHLEPGVDSGATTRSRSELPATLDGYAERITRRIAAFESLRTVAPGEAADGLGPGLVDLELRQLHDRLECLRASRDLVS